MPLDSWVTSSPLDNIRPTLIERAKKRAIQQLSPTSWRVSGESSLGDSYPSYDVALIGDKYRCDCESHHGGQHRRLCSHKVRVLIWVSAEGEEPTASPTPAEGSGIRETSHPSPEPVSEFPLAEVIPFLPKVTADTPVPSPQHPMFGSPGLPAKFEEIREGQWEAVKEIIGHLRDGVTAVVLDAPTGCLSGDTMIGVNRAGKGWQLRIDDLVHRFNGGWPTPEGRGGKKTWNPDIPTQIQQSVDGVMRLSEITHAVYSGDQMTYTLKTSRGRCIRATANHPFMSDRGWVPLGELTEGDILHVLGKQGGRGPNKPKPWYRLVSSLPNHPYAGRRGVRIGKGGFSVPRHRLVAEARLNDLPYEDFIERVKKGDIGGLIFLDPKEFAVHHRDHDHLNNHPDNLEVMTPREHGRHHSKANRRNVAFHIDTDVVRSIEPYGIEPTYDLTMKDDPNFIANGFVVHNSGKTIVGEVVRRLYAGTLPSTYMCSTKPLQRQVATDFPYARVLMGRANYPTADRPDLTADDCTMERTRLPACVNCPQVKDQTAQWTHDQHGEEGRHCFFCHPVSSCPYQQAKEAAVEAKFSILNVAYFLAETQGYASQFTGRDLVIVDEASLLESELLRHIEITLTPYMRKELRIFTLPKKTVEEDWVRWVEEEVIPALDRALMKHDKEKGQMQMMVGLPPDPKERRKVKRLRELRSKLKDLLRPVVIEDPKTGETREVPELLAGWVYEWGGKDDPDKVYATFRPVKVGRLAREALWPKAKQFLLMDATPVSVEQLLEDDLGLEPGEYAVVQMESTFPPERRPVIVDSRADMKWSKEHGGIHPSELAKMRDAIDEIIGDNPGVRILVHTVSYALGKYLYEHSGSDRVMTYWSSNERDQALSAFLAKEDSVLLAPSFERGIDLPEEDCRVIIVAKCPFPFLGDARVKKRLYGDRAKGQRWYDIETIRSLVQMTGRGMRHKGDFCKSVLLDSQIRRVYLKQQKYFPQWWRDAVILGQYDPKSQERLEKVATIEEEINDRRRDRALAGGRGGGGKDDSLPDPF